MKKGEILLIDFPFTDLTSVKQHPALIIQINGEDLTLLPVTSKFNPKNRYSYRLVNSLERNGLYDILL